MTLAGLATSYLRFDRMEQRQVPQRYVNAGSRTDCGIKKSVGQPTKFDLVQRSDYHILQRFYQANMLKVANVVFAMLETSGGNKREAMWSRKQHGDRRIEQAIFTGQHGGDSAMEQI